MARGLIPAIAVIATLCGCSSGGGGGGTNDLGINCAGLTGATAEAVTSCAGGCGGAFSDAAVDGDLGTYAILQLNSNAAGSLSIRATAADGVSYPPGTPAGVVYGIERSGGDSLNTTETISTYLDGVLQQTGNSNAPNTATNSDVAPGRRIMTTTLPFDAIEVTYNQTGGTAAVEVQVYEFCTSSN
jgi:hypothetical protein